MMNRFGPAWRCCWEKIEQTDDAVKLLEHSLKGTPADRETYLNLSQVYERGRRYADAEQAAHKAESFAAEPHDNEIAWLLLGAVYERQKQFDKAEEPNSRKFWT